jgi:hypothetical protein
MAIPAWSVAPGGDIVLCLLILRIGRLLLEFFKGVLFCYSSAYIVRQWV